MICIRSSFHIGNQNSSGASIPRLSPNVLSMGEMPLLSGSLIFSSIPVNAIEIRDERTPNRIQAGLSPIPNHRFRGNRIAVPAVK